MSYCRFGENDAYIFLTTSGFDCCGCLLAERIKLDKPYKDRLGITHEYSYKHVGPFKTPREILEHVEVHRKAGHHISLDVDARIHEEYPDLDVNVEETEAEREVREAMNQRLLTKMKLDL